MATCGVLNISDATAVLNARECRSGSLPAHLYYLTGGAGVNTRRILKSGLLLPAGQRGIARAICSGVEMSFSWVKPPRVFVYQRLATVKLAL